LPGSFSCCFLLQKSGKNTKKGCIFIKKNVKIRQFLDFYKGNITFFLNQLIFAIKKGQKMTQKMTQKNILKKKFIYFIA
jgi:hypothetical protein